MNPRHLIVASAIGLAAFSSLAAAQVEGQKVVAPSPEKAGPVHDIARWVDDSIFGVVIIDIHNADLPAAINQLAESAGRIESGGELKREDIQRIKSEMVKAREDVEKWVADYKAAGGGQVWCLMSPQPAVCFLTNEGADTDKLKEMIGKLKFAEGGKAIFRRGVIIAGSNLRGLPVDELSPERAEQLKAALDAARTPGTDKPVVRLALIPTDAHRLMLSAVLPRLSEMANIQVAKDLNTKIKWAAAAASNIPNPEVQAVIQTTGAQPAQQTAALANAMIILGSKEAPPGALVEVLRELKFLANEDRAELRVSTTTTRRITESLTLPIVSAREAARRVRAMSMTRQQLIAVHSYAADNQDKLPAKLDDLKEYLAGADLQHPDGKGWVYTKPAGKLAELQNPAQVVLLHETYKTWPDKGLIVGFADGHVEVVDTEDRFRELLRPR